MNQRWSNCLEFFVNYSSVICLIDCILLPCFVFIFGFLNIFSNFTTFEYVIHIIGLVFVIPLGLISVILNYKKTKNFILFTIGFLGIVIIVASNFFTNHLAQNLLSLSGCFLLILSNFISRRIYKHQSCKDCSMFSTSEA